MNKKNRPITDFFSKARATAEEAEAELSAIATSE